MKNFIHTTLQGLLKSLDIGFAKDELAYLSSQGKNELQIRDKIAWRLHNSINSEFGDDNLYVVRREWAPEGRGREKVDLAILEMDSTKTVVVRAIALIEFKAQSIARPEKWFVNEFVHDVAKMRKLKQESIVCKGADLYFAFIETGQECKANEYKSILSYAVYQNGKIVYHNEKGYLSAIKTHWMTFENALGESITIHAPKAIYIGKAFGYKQYISPLLIGPISQK